jgi:AraC-like DNA-binding protein
MFRRAGLDMDAIQRPGARYPMSSMLRLWQQAREDTDDPCIGLFAAQRLRPQALHALGLSWLSSRTLGDGLRRMARYARIASTNLRITLEPAANRTKVVVASRSRQLAPAPEAIDMTLAVVVKMCRLMTDSHFAPASVLLQRADDGHAAQYIDIFKAPVLFGSTVDGLCFDNAVLDDPVPAGNDELAQDMDRIAERYLATLDPDRVQDRVRRILLTLLPSGEADQKAVAKTLHLSVSTLQRQLRSEGAGYRQILDETRRGLAEQLIREQGYSLGQIAYLLGFSEPANFSRAYKRWTGHAPSEARKD